MASICASISTSTPTFSLIRKPSVTTCGLGLSLMSKIGKVKCLMESNPIITSEEVAPKLRMGAPSFMVAAMAASMTSSTAMALVDDRMSTEGTGLPFGLSNNLLSLIWTLYFVYTGSLDEDEESGLSL